MLEKYGYDKLDPNNFIDLIIYYDKWYYNNRSANEMMLLEKKDNYSYMMSKGLYKMIYKLFTIGCYDYNLIGDNETKKKIKNLLNHLSGIR